jgi:hypothetical protein
MPHPFGSFPSEFSPRSSRAHLSEPLAPLWLSTRMQRRTARRLVTVCFTDPHTLQHGCRTPQTTMGSLSACRGTPPSYPGPWAAESPPTAGFTHFEALFLLRIRSHRHQMSPEPEADTLLGFCPSGAFSSHASDSRSRQTPRVKTGTNLRSQASHLSTLRGESTSPPLDHVGLRLERPCNLSSQVRPSRHESGTASSTDTSPLQTGLPRR